MLLGDYPSRSLAQTPELRNIHSQPSFIVSSSDVEIAVTKMGGQMAPVTFYRKSDKAIQPYHISPWQDEPTKPMPAPVLNALRGDFFCMPFGGNGDKVNGEKHAPHGEVVSSEWRNASIHRSGNVTKLSMALETEVRRGKVIKELMLKEGQNVIYSKHTIQGFAGQVPLGHHATLAMPYKEGTVRIATSAFKFGMTYPGLFSDPTQGEYQSLLPGSRWTDLTKVPVAWKGMPDADLTRLPARVGYADLVQVINDSPRNKNEPAWVTATFTDDNFIWFAFKNPDVLRSTVFWIENRGRHSFPWNGRNNCLGVEDVTAYFADGIAPSINDNILNKEGVKTTVELKADSSTVINYVQGVVRVPSNFEIVSTVEFESGHATFVSASGVRVKAEVNHAFLFTGDLE